MNDPNIKRKGRHGKMPTRGGSSDDVETNGATIEHQTVNNPSPLNITKGGEKVEVKAKVVRQAANVATSLCTGKMTPRHYLALLEFWTDEPTGWEQMPA